MNCEELVGSLSDYIDGALPDDSRLSVEDHLAHCPGCHVVLDSTACTILLYRAARTRALTEERRQALLQRLEAACAGCRDGKPDDRS
jgi:anti-sigma factor RsiW